MSPKHLHRYVTEFARRHNVLPLPVSDRMRKVVAGRAGKRLTFKELVA